MSPWIIIVFFIFLVYWSKCGYCTAFSGHTFGHFSFNRLFLQENCSAPWCLGPVNGQPVTRSEFLYVYQKNHPTKKNDFSRESMQEYLDLYVNFKLKVAEAQSLRIDTTRKVREELDKYGDQLIKSNFDKEVLRFWWLPT